MKILVADGQKDTAHSLRIGLTEAGYSVVTVDNGTQAFLRATEDDFDVMVTVAAGVFAQCRHTMTADVRLRPSPFGKSSNTATFENVLQ